MGMELTWDPEHLIHSLPQQTVSRDTTYTAILFCRLFEVGFPAVCPPNSSFTCLRGIISLIIIRLLKQSVCLLKLCLLRLCDPPRSGSGTLSIATKITTTYGPDSFIGRLVSTMFGSTETTFYVIAVYYGPVCKYQKNTACCCCRSYCRCSGYLGRIVYL